LTEDLKELSSSRDWSGTGVDDSVEVYKVRTARFHEC